MRAVGRVGLQNFASVFSSPYFSNILTNTVLISIYKLVVGIPAGVVVALLLNEVWLRWFRGAVQTVILLPRGDGLSWRPDGHSLVFATLGEGAGPPNVTGIWQVADTGGGHGEAHHQPSRR